MQIEQLIAARKTAEKAVEDMPDGSLKTAAFETILKELLQGDTPNNKAAGAGTRAPAGRSSIPVKKVPISTGTKSRILGLVEEGFFSAQRTLTEIQDALAERGWHYDQNHLSTPLMRLVRQKALRRTQVSEGAKKVWKYSNY